MDISLSELLESRDNRQSKQQELIDAYQQPVVSLTLVMPGPTKKNESTAKLAPVGVSAIEQAFGEAAVIYASEYDLPTGFEAFFVVSMTEEEAKTIACDIEDNHPLGRLFDIDIIGKNKIPVSREQIGRPPRKCLLCDQNSRDCMRNQTHELSDLLNKIQEMINTSSFYV